ncbi:MAG: NlpC/P60 family protein [Lachnospiraceae bacterium]
MKKRILCILLICIMTFGSALSVLAETSQDVQKEKEKTQEALDALNERVDDIEQQKQAVSEEIVVLDTELVDVLTSISICVDEIAAKEDEIGVVKEELKKVQEDAVVQYENMKTRIRFMYEKGDSAYMAVLLEADSWPDMLNKASYAEELYSYDREMLNLYEQTIQRISDYKTELEIEEADLLTSKNELKEQQDYLENIINTKKQSVINFEDQLAQATAQAAEFKNQLEEQTARIKELEAKEEAERKEKARQEELAKNNVAVAKGNGSSTKVDSSQVVENVVSSSEGSALGRDVAAYGCQFIGNPYVFGGTSLTNGTDCSGFTQSVYAHFGIRIPRDSTSQRFFGTGVDYSQAQPGDLICYAGHVGLYIGNGQIVHASSERTGIKISNATYRTILAVRRVL